MFLVERPSVTFDSRLHMPRTTSTNSPKLSVRIPLELNLVNEAHFWRKISPLYSPSFRCKRTSSHALLAGRVTSSYTICISGWAAGLSTNILLYARHVCVYHAYCIASSSLIPKVQLSPMGKRRHTNPDLHFKNRGRNRPRQNPYVANGR